MMTRPPCSSAPCPSPCRPRPPLVAERLSDRLAARLARRSSPGAGARRPAADRAAARRGPRRLAHGGARSGAPAASRAGWCGRARAPASTSPRRRAHRALAFDPACSNRCRRWCRCVEVRRVLEGEIAALAAERATPRPDRGAAPRTRGDRQRRRRRRRRRRRGPGVPPRDRRGDRQPAVRPPARISRAVPARGMRITRGNEARRPDFMEAVRAEHRAIVDAIAAARPGAGAPARASSTCCAASRLRSPADRRRPLPPGRAHAGASAR